MEFNCNKCAREGASFVCINCEIYLCTICFEQHNRVCKHGQKREDDSFIEIGRYLFKTIQCENDRRAKLVKDRLSFKFRVEVHGSTPSKIQTCHISGLMVLRDGRLAVVDHANSHIKIFTASKQELHTTIAVTNWKPFAITETSKITELDESAKFMPRMAKKYLMKSSSIAFTCISRSEIVILDITVDPVKVVQRLKVETPLRCIAYVNEGFIGLCQKRDLVYVFTSEGEIVTTIDTGIGHGRHLRLTVNQNLKLIYVTSYCDDTIKSFSFEGNLINTYKQENLSPADACIDEDNNILVCSRLRPTYIIYKLSADFHQCEKFVDKDLVDLDSAWGVACRYDHLNISHDCDSKFSDKITAIRYE